MKPRFLSPSVILLPGLAGVALLLAACGEPNGGGTANARQTPLRPGDMNIGNTLYTERCVECHGPRGELAGKRGAIPLRDLATMQILQTLKNYQGNVDATPWWSEFKIGLEDQEISDLVAYIEELQAQP